MWIGMKKSRGEEVNILETGEKVVVIEGSVPLGVKDMIAVFIRAVVELSD